jgi:hypothetical protein
MGWMQPRIEGDPNTYRNWASSVLPYIKSLQVYVCPSAKHALRMARLARRLKSIFPAAATPAIL